MKKSQAFAALRSAVVAELQQQIDRELLPKFNAEVVDIRQRWEKSRPEGEALADHRKRADIADLVVRRDAFISELNVDMQNTLKKRVSEYGGTIEEIEVTDKDGSKKKVLEAKFDDGSSARHPRSLWINYKAFERV